MTPVFWVIVALAAVACCALGLTPQARANYTNILKEVYASDDMYRTFNRTRVGLAKLERKPVDIDWGAQYRWPVHTNTGVGGASSAESATLPEPEAESNDWLKFDMKTHVNRIGLTGQVIHSTRGRAAAVAQALEFKATQAVQSARDFYASRMYTHASGQVVKCQAAISNTTNAVIRVESVRRLRIGMSIFVAKISDEALTHGTAAVTTILDIAPSTRQVTISGTLAGTPLTSWAAPDAYGNSDHALFYGEEIGTARGTWGLEDIIYDSNPPGSAIGNFGEVDRTVAGNDWAKGRVLDLAGEVITHTRADQAMDLVSVMGEGNVEFFLTTPEILRDVKELSLGDKRYGGREKTADGYFEFGMLAGKPCFADKYCSPRTIYGIDPNKLWFAEQKPLDWEDDDGNILSRMEDKWAYQALLTRMYQLCGVPNCHVAITNVRSNTSE